MRGPVPPLALPPLSDWLVADCSREMHPESAQTAARSVRLPSPYSFSSGHVDLSRRRRRKRLLPPPRTSYAASVWETRLSSRLDKLLWKKSAYAENDEARSLLICACPRFLPQKKTDWALYSGVARYRGGAARRRSAASHTGQKMKSVNNRNSLRKMYLLCFQMS